MNWKDFFKPTKMKIIVSIALVAIIILISFNLSQMGGGNKEFRNILSIPLSSIEYVKTYCGISPYVECTPGISFVVDYYKLTAFIIDILFWYLISCTIIYTYKKVKKK